MLALALVATAATEVNAIESQTDTIGQPTSPDLGWEIIGDPIVDDIIIKRDLVILPEVTQEDDALCFTSPTAMSLPYYIYERNTIVESGTLTLVAQEKEIINIQHLPSGTYLFVLNFGNICYGCRFEVE